MREKIIKQDSRENKLDITYAISSALGVSLLFFGDSKLMTVLKATEARTKLYSLIDETANTHQPVLITGKRGNAVLISEDDWNAMAETLHLLSVSGMRESIKEGMKKPISECSEELDW